MAADSHTIKRELEKFVERSTSGESVPTRIMAAIANSIANKIVALAELGADAALDIQRLSDQLGGDVGVSVSNAIETVLARQSDGPTGPTNPFTGSLQQKFEHLLSYMPEELHMKCTGADATSEQVEIWLAEHHRAVGIVNPCPQTCGNAVAYMAFCSVQRERVFPSYIELYNSVQNFASVVQACKPRPCVGPKVYPSDPNDLPKELYDQAFRDNPPVTYDLARVRQIRAKHIPLRRTSTLLPVEFRNGGRSNVARPRGDDIDARRSYGSSRDRMRSISDSHGRRDSFELQIHDSGRRRRHRSPSRRRSRSRSRSRSHRRNKHHRHRSRSGSHGRRVPSRSRPALAALCDGDATNIFGRSPSRGADDQDALNSAAAKLRPKSRAEQRSRSRDGDAAASAAAGVGSAAIPNAAVAGETQAALDAERKCIERLLAKKQASKAKSGPPPFWVPAEGGKPSYLAQVIKGKLVPVKADDGARKGVGRPRKDTSKVKPEVSEAESEIKSEEESDGDGESTPCLRKPSAAVLRRPSCADSKVKSEAVKAVKAVKAEPGGAPSMPRDFSSTAGPQTVHYNGGKITVSFPKKGFRVFADCSSANPSDRCLKFADYATKKQAWLAALAMIDAAR